MVFSIWLEYGVFKCFLVLFLGEQTFFLKVFMPMPVGGSGLKVCAVTVKIYRQVTQELTTMSLPDSQGSSPFFSCLSEASYACLLYCVQRRLIVKGDLGGNPAKKECYGGDGYC